MHAFSRSQDQTQFFRAGGSDSYGIPTPLGQRPVRSPKPAPPNGGSRRKEPPPPPPPNLRKTATALGFFFRPPTPIPLGGEKLTGVRAHPRGKGGKGGKGGQS
jgi:hypothetical protein